MTIWERGMMILEEIEIREDQEEEMEVAIYHAQVEDREVVSQEVADQVEVDQVEEDQDRPMEDFDPVSVRD